MPKPMRRYKADILPELQREEAQRLRDRVITLEGHRAQWRRLAHRYRDALAEIGGPAALKALHDIEEGHPPDEAAQHK